MKRLSAAALPHLESIQQPSYDRASVKASIVHIGLGAFHRAHQAYYTEQVMNELGGDWGIIGCSLRSNTVQKQLEPQQGLYTLLVRGEISTPQIIGAVQKVLVGPQDLSAVIDAIAHEQTEIVSLTITEKGYCHNPATGLLNFDHPDIQHDLASPSAPKTAIGYIVAGLKRRKDNGLSGITVMSCDNLPDNGLVTKQVVLAYAKKTCSELHHWIEQHVSFPGTMIDRIVPATTQADIQLLQEQYGYEDQAMVVAEPFTQWVVEDDFCGDRPQWERAGAIVVSDVSVYEKMKLRLLNGSHSLLAYVGFLSGHQTIYQTMQDEPLVELTRQFMASASETLSMPEGFSVVEYQQQLIERFSNPGLQHKTWQIAMDGSQKVPQRWLSTMRDLIEREACIDVFCLALAAWLRYSLGVDEKGSAIELSDPLSAQLKGLAEENKGQYLEYVSAFFAVEAVFEQDFFCNQEAIKKTAQYLQDIFTHGMSGTFKHYLQAKGGSTHE